MTSNTIFRYHANWVSATFSRYPYIVFDIFLRVKTFAMKLFLIARERDLLPHGLIFREERSSVFLTQGNEMKIEKNKLIQKFAFFRLLLQNCAA